MRFLPLLFLLFFLSGCLLLSGEETSIDLVDQSGILSTTFVSGEGSEERTLRVSEGPTTLQVIVIVGVESGDLQIEILQPDGAVVFALAAQPDSQLTRSSWVRSDDQGQIRYRVTARGARNGSYQIFVQP
ncbi:hypothetical protein OSCT_2319 [Oscillochloris trichoides DG-6]|uniref:Uncharacterized protein n=1 Tax=Oscillochloris trichoides DG-6 TaxID=765420 RepID=E1IG68_9CHLR|nr:hypothetical protein [Oscillochloris trichoides]EFO79802.1 hypothetical protein OSCT_2319 [Oscillochloris trichoides DG-6]